MLAYKKITYDVLDIAIFFVYTALYRSSFGGD